MAFRTNFITTAFRSSCPAPSPFARPLRAYHFTTRPKVSPRSRAIAIARPAPTVSRISPLGLGIAASLALFTFWPSRRTQCQSSTTTGQFTSPPVAGETRTPLDDRRPTSMVSTYELSFGAVCGICAGVFIKKGAKALAFVLGGAFVFLQYMASKSYVTVDWAKIGSRYDTSFGSKTASGYQGPTVGKVWAKFTDFLTSNFQQRASFLAGLALGIRLG